MARRAVWLSEVGDYLLGNLWRAQRGQAFSSNVVEWLVVRLPVKAWFRTRPHMLGRSFASEIALATQDPALVKELLRYASVVSTDVYLYLCWHDMRAAVDTHARRLGPGHDPGDVPSPLRLRSWRHSPNATGASSGLEALMGEHRLEGEWGPARLSVVPATGGLFTQARRRAVASWPSDCYGLSRLCVGHRSEFTRSGHDDLEPWFARVNLNLLSAPERRGLPGGEPRVAKLPSPCRCRWQRVRDAQLLVVERRKMPDSAWWQPSALSKLG